MCASRKRACGLFIKDVCGRFDFGTGCLSLWVGQGVVRVRLVKLAMQKPEAVLMALKDPESSQGTGFCPVIIAENVLRAHPTVPTRFDSFRAFQDFYRVVVAKVSKRVRQVLRIACENANSFWSAQ